MTDVLVDSDVFIDHLRGARRLVVGAGDAYSVVTRCELFAGSRVDEQVVRELLAPLTELPVDTAIAEHAGRIRRTTGVRIADALIAATALEHGLPLMTRNVRDFAQVPGVQVVAPPTSAV